jgi:hypothetical protein
MEKLVQKVVGNSYKIMQRFERFVMSCKRMTKMDRGSFQGGCPPMARASMTFFIVVGFEAKFEMI